MDAKELLDADLLVPAATVLAVFVLFVVLLMSASWKSCSKERMRAGEETEDVTDGGSQFVEEEGAVVRRSLRVRSRQTGEGVNGTPVAKTTESAIQTTPKTKRTSAKPKTPAFEAGTPYSTRSRRTTPLVTPETTSQAKTAKSSGADEDERPAVTSPPRRGRTPRV